LISSQTANHSRGEIIDDSNSPSPRSKITKPAKSKSRSAKETDQELTSDFKSVDDDSNTLLHSGPVLGNLPSLRKNLASPSNTASNGKPFESQLENLLDDDHHRSSFTASEVLATKPSKKADDKKTKKKKRFTATPEADDIPSKYKCQLTHRLMTEPVKSIYGNIFDKSAIMSWLSQQGRICPLTGDIFPLTSVLMRYLP